MPPPAVRRLLMYLTKRRLRGMAKDAVRPAGKGIAEPAAEGPGVLERILRPTKPSHVPPEFELIPGAERQGYRLTPPKDFSPEEKTLFKEMRFPKPPQGASLEERAEFFIKRASALRNAADRLGVRPRKHKAAAQRFRRRADQIEAYGKAIKAGGPLPAEVVSPEAVRVPEGFPVKKGRSVVFADRNQRSWQRLREIVDEMKVPRGFQPAEQVESQLKELGQLFRKTRKMSVRQREGLQRAREVKTELRTRGSGYLERRADQLLREAETSRGRGDVSIGTAAGAVEGRLGKTFGVSENELIQARRAAEDLRLYDPDLYGKRPVEDIMQELLEGGFERTGFGQRAIRALQEARQPLGLQRGQPLPEEGVYKALAGLFPKKFGGLGQKTRERTKGAFRSLYEKLVEGSRGRSRDPFEEIL